MKLTIIEINVKRLQNMLQQNDNHTFHRQLLAIISNRILLLSAYSEPHSKHKTQYEYHKEKHIEKQRNLIFMNKYKSILRCTLLPRMYKLSCFIKPLSCLLYWYTWE